MTTIKEEKLWNVFIYPIMRIEILNIKAENAIEATEEAERSFNGNQNYFLRNAEFAEEISYYLVDEVGDDDFNNSIIIENQ